MKRDDSTLRESEAHWRRLIDHMSDMVAEVNLKGVYQYANPSYKHILGYAPSSLLGKSFFQYVPPEDLDKVITTFNTGIDQGSPQRLEHLYRHAEGNYIWLETVGNPVFNAQGTITSMVLVVREVTERKQREDRLRYLGWHDYLTGLYNRAYFEEEMHRVKSKCLNAIGIIICDVDGLRFINDTLGHDKGDILLVELASILQRVFRASDVVARIGGDEFAVLLTNSSRLTAEKAGQRIQEAINSYNQANPNLLLNVSIGLAVAEQGVNIHHLFKEADNNMHREKLHRSQSKRNAIAYTLKQALEARDIMIKGHTERLKKLISVLALVIGIPNHRIQDLCLLAQFHDVGKVGISDRILLKPDPLTPEEFKEIQRHCEIGYRIAQAAPDLMPIADWILKHHEWWNGQGYPLGLKGEEIPLECRILAVVDAFDAMTSDRPYQKAISLEVAIDELQRGAGIQFDPQIVKAFLQIVKKLKINRLLYSSMFLG